MSFNHHWEDSHNALGFQCHHVGRMPKLREPSKDIWISYASVPDLHTTYRGHCVGDGELDDYLEYSGFPPEEPMPSSAFHEEGYVGGCSTTKWFWRD